MKKIILFGLATIVSVTSAHAGLFDSLLGKKKEPATLEEACNKDEISKVCPQVLLGTKTTTECLTENITSLSDKCATFVKKAATQKIEDAKATVTEKTDAATAKVESVKTDTTAKVDEAKAKAEKTKADAKAKSDAAKAESKAKTEKAKADAKAKTDGVKAGGKEITDSARETSKSLKSMF